MILQVGGFWVYGKGYLRDRGTQQVVKGTGFRALVHGLFGESIGFGASSLRLKAHRNTEAATYSKTSRA